MLIMIPVTTTALGTTPPWKLKNASGLFNLTRNLGGAVGLALINTLLNKRLDLHLARLHEQVAWGRDGRRGSACQVHGADGAFRLRCLACRHEEARATCAQAGDRHGHRRRVYGR